MERRVTADSQHPSNEIENNVELKSFIDRVVIPTLVERIRKHLDVEADIPGASRHGEEGEDGPCEVSKAPGLRVC